jgi:hypothetical protein
MYTDPSGEFIFGIINAVKDLFTNIGNSIGNIINGRTDKWNWNSTCNAWKIDVGLFKGDIGQIISRFTWELPQTILGYGLSQSANLFNDVRSVDYYGGATVVNNKWLSSGQGITLGSYINGGGSIKAGTGNTEGHHLFMHEYGHYRQSQGFGPLYLFRFGIPSLISAAGDGKHNLHPVEQDANVRAFNYFSNKYGITEADWRNDINPKDMGYQYFGWHDILFIGMSIGRAVLTANPFAIFIDLPLYYYGHYQSLMKRQ